MTTERSGYSATSTRLTHGGEGSTGSHRLPERFNPPRERSRWPQRQRAAATRALARIELLHRGGGQGRGERVTVAGDSQRKTSESSPWNSAEVGLHLGYWCDVLPASHSHVNHRYSPASPAARSRNKSCSYIDESWTFRSPLSQGRLGRVGAKKRLRCSSRRPSPGNPGSSWGTGSNNDG
jgi:hypothetical protein